MKKNSVFLLLILLTQVLLLANWQFSDWPEMFSYAYLLNHSYQLYKDIINPYTPLLSFGLSFFFKFFPYSITSLKLATYLIILLIDLLLLLTLKIIKAKNIFLFFSLFILWQIILEGNGLWFDLVISPLALLIFLLLTKYQKLPNAKNLVLIGLILGIMFLIKQTSLIYIAPVIFLVLSNTQKFTQKLKNSLVLLSAWSIPVVFSLFYFYYQHNLSDYVYWAYIYPLRHLKSSGFALIPTMKQLLITLLFLSPTVVVFKNYKDKKVQILILFILTSTVFAIPRFSYFHLQPVIPFIILLLAYTGNVFNPKRTYTTFLFIFSLVTVSTFLYFAYKYIGKEPRFYNSQTQATAKALNKQIAPGTSVFFYNTSSEHFVFTGLLPAKPWADTFPWYLEVPGLQERIVTGIEDNKISYAIFKPFQKQGPSTPGSYIPQIIDQYIKRNFTSFTQIENTIWILQR